MKTVRFYGHSDDCFEIDGCFREELPTQQVENEDLPVTVVIASDSGSIRVIGAYTGPGVWCFGIGPAVEGEPLPDWPIRFDLQHDYSAALEIDLPDDAILTMPETHDDH